MALKRGKISELWYLALHSQQTCHWLVILFINRISQVLRFHKMALPGRPFSEERLLELVMWLFGCSCIHHTRQYVRFHVNPFQGGTWFKNYSKRVQVSNTRIFHSLTTSSLMVVKYIEHWFLMSVYNEVSSSWEKPFKWEVFHSCSVLLLAFLLMHPSTSNRILSSTPLTTALSSC